MPGVLCRTAVRATHQSLRFVTGRPLRAQNYHAVCRAAPCSVVCTLNATRLAEPHIPLRVDMRSKTKKAKKKEEQKKQKGREAGRSSKTSDKLRINLSENEMCAVVNLSEFEQQMKQHLDVLKKEYVQNLSTRATGGALDQIVVETPDGKFPLIQLAQVTQKDLNLFVVNMTMSPQYIGNVKTALMAVGRNPQQDGTTLFVPIPKITRERRDELVKSAKAMCDKAKDRLRLTHNRFVKEAKNQEGFEKDYIRNLLQTMQAFFKDCCEEAENLKLDKQNDLSQDR